MSGDTMQLRYSLCQKLHLQPAELMMLTVGIAAGIVDIMLILSKGSEIDIPAYGGLLALILLVIPLGMFYRLKGRSERIASALICTGAFIFFSACLSLFNYLLLPIVRPLIDVPIAQVDALFGFYWPNVMAFAAENPIPTFILKVAYMTTIPQFAMLVVILGLSGRMRDLHVMITSVTITATLTICFWGLFPTLGAKSMYILTPEMWAAINPIVNEEYAKDLLHIGEHGPGLISPKEIRGLIAFPSYHAVLAFTAIYAARNIPVLAQFFLVLNLLILPGIFIHGGHHLMDLPAGFAMFAFGTWLAARAVHSDYEHRGAPAFVAN
ncbi:MAG: phosphatase PAP2 family protein [Pseudomonadota bacterium]